MVAPQFLQTGIDFALFDGISSDVEFMRKLMNEQSVMCLPASVFRCPGFFRLVLTVPFVRHAIRRGTAHIPQDKTKEAIGRIEAFCAAHHKPQ